MSEDRMIKFTKVELMLAIEYYYNKKMKSHNGGDLYQQYLGVKTLQIMKNRSSKYICKFEVGKSE